RPAYRVAQAAGGIAVMPQGAPWPKVEREEGRCGPAAGITRCPRARLAVLALNGLKRNVTHRRLTRPGSSRTGAIAPLLLPGPARPAPRAAPGRRARRRRRPGRAAVQVATLGQQLGPLPGGGLVALLG